ncbi:haloacid dehalogenase [Delitschia confertaspora ATCC 74209]|uniref:Haloacid dehalogenase n=1 Tax=Delitschia confertaspora ATCC 74209 TaxID=1513339 RepID=A0A9P4MM61_9PLEO|nr:haloacid dehalogenase [Delitschia confertaspora ATCC 74209]
MSSLTEFRVLCFDVYGTLIDWETGVISALQPLLEANNRTDLSRGQLLEIFHDIEKSQQQKTPDMTYTELLTTVHPQLAARLALETPSVEDSRVFGQSIGRWPAFPDTVNALHELSKRYHLVVLSNVDRESFAATNAGPLQGFNFSMIITAQDVGSYKPNPRNFEVMLEKVQSKFGVGKSQVLQVAQSQFHDHHPAHTMGIKSCWIVRPGAIMGNKEEEIYDWKFDTLGDLAWEVDKELKAQ